ncbi:MAG: ABC transporter ATP-binding protein [Oscillospiraceae bacterium]|nr:ABC transporter ATP-binding protein [Oscillospiraceae bacterium]
MDCSQKKLIISDLCKEYATLNGRVIAIDHMSLTVNEGEFVAVVGKSGSGKTTLLNMIAGLDRPDSGRIYLDDIEINRLSGRESAKIRRQKVGVIYQFFNLIPELNVIENITLPTELDGRVIDKAELASIIAKIGLSGREQAYPSMLSGGQQQRIAIARALFSKPSILLADEPTGNLDRESLREVLDLLTAMNQEYRITVLVVTHSTEIANSAGRVITISDGKIISDRRQ